MLRAILIAAALGATRPHSWRQPVASVRAPHRSLVRLSTLEEPQHISATPPVAAPVIQDAAAPPVVAPRLLTIEDFILRSGPPSFFWPAGEPPAGSTKPVLVYLPGIEMTGYTMSSQLERLAPEYDVRIFRVPPTDLTPGAELHRYIEPELEVLAAEGRKIVLMGESFGGVLALDVLLRLTAAGKEGQVSHLVLMNPATCMPATPWPSLAAVIEGMPPQAFSALPIALSPLLANPLRLIDFTAPPAADGPGPAGRGVAADDSRSATSVLAEALGLPDQLPLPEVAAAIEGATGAALAALGQSVGPVRDAGASGWAPPDLVVQRLVGLFPVLSQLPMALPQSTLAFRLRELDSLARDVNGRDWSRARTPALVICSSDDMLIPSPSAARVIQRRLLGTRVKTLEGAGHAPLLETNVDLRGILTEAHVLSQPRPVPRDYAAPGRVAPPLQKQQKVSEETLRPIRRLVSPRFFSTTASGVRLPGLGAVPDPTDEHGARHRPILFVGNHQQIGVLDIPLVVEELLAQRSIFTRALAHPVAFAQATGAPDDPPSEQQLALANTRLDEDAILGVDRGARDNVLRTWLPGLGQAQEAERQRRREAQASGTSGRGTGGMFGGAIDIAEFGAVPVSGRNLYRLLQRNEAVLLYPGGARQSPRPRPGASHGERAPPRRAHSAPAPFSTAAAAFALFRRSLHPRADPSRAPELTERRTPPCFLYHPLSFLVFLVSQASPRRSSRAAPSTRSTGPKATPKQTSCAWPRRRTQSSCRLPRWARTMSSMLRMRRICSRCRGWATRYAGSRPRCRRAARASPSCRPSPSSRCRCRASTSALAAPSMRRQSTQRMWPRPPLRTRRSSESWRAASNGFSSEETQTRTAISAGAWRTRHRLTGSGKRPPSASEVDVV